MDWVIPITAIINGFGLGVFILMSLMLYKISGLYGLIFNAGSKYIDVHCSTDFLVSLKHRT